MAIFIDFSHQGNIQRKSSSWWAYMTAAWSLKSSKSTYSSFAQTMRVEPKIMSALTLKTRNDRVFRAVPRSQLFKKKRFSRFIVSDPARVKILVRRSSFPSFFVRLSHDFAFIIFLLVDCFPVTEVTMILSI